jgi:hypothetical protein
MGEKVAYEDKVNGCELSKTNPGYTEAIGVRLIYQHNKR